MRISSATEGSCGYLALLMCLVGLCRSQCPRMCLCLERNTLLKCVGVEAIAVPYVPFSFRAAITEM